MRIFFFGRLGEQIGREMDVDVPTGGTTVAALRRLIVEARPDAAEALAAPGIRAAIDQAIAAEDAPVRPGQEVAFLSPLSGG